MTEVPRWINIPSQEQQNEEEKSEDPKEKKSRIVENAHVLADAHRVWQTALNKSVEVALKREMEDALDDPMDIESTCKKNERKAALKHQDSGR